MYTDYITKIAKAITEGAKAEQVAEMVNEAYDYDEYAIADADLDYDAHCIAVEVMQINGWNVDASMDYDAINEVSAKAERAYVKASDKVYMAYEVRVDARWRVASLFGKYWA